MPVCINKWDRHLRDRHLTGVVSGINTKYIYIYIYIYMGKSCVDYKKISV